MRLLREVPETAMVAAFLKAEFSSPRFGDDLRRQLQTLDAGEAVVTRPDLADQRENDLRARLLGAYRGYQRNREMFDGVPTDLIWHAAEITREEIGSLRYVDYSYWNELTDHTSLVRDAVTNIRQGRLVFDVPNDRFWTVAELISRGEHAFEPMILWQRGGNLEILEGHLRATAFGLAGEQAPATTGVLVGLPPRPG